jgi:hypothetical protein
MAGTSFRQGDTISSYKQINEIKKDKDKIRKKKRRKHKRTDIAWDNKYWRTILSEPTMGIISTYHDPEYDKAKKCVPYSNYTGNKSNSPNEDTGTIVKQTDASKKNDKEPIPKDSYPTTAFILPTALALRNPFSKKKKA